MSVQTYPFTRNGLRRALRALGATPAAVAKTLFDHGLQGMRGDCDLCPLALYLQIAIPDARVHRVFEDRVVAYAALDGSDAIAVMLPQPVREFVLGYDLGGFSALESEVSDAA